MRLRSSSSLLAAFVALSVSAADAQTRRPFRTEFGPTERDELRADQLVLTGGVYTGADDTTRLAGPLLLDEALQSGQMHQGINLALALTRRRPAGLSITASGASAIRYYHSLDRIGTQRHSVSAVGEFVASRKWSFQFGQDVSYSPSYSLLLAGAPEIGAPAEHAQGSLDYDVGRSRQFVLGSSGGAKYVWSNSREIAAGYSLNYTNYLSARQRDFGIQQATVRLTQRLTGGVAVKLGYGLGSGSGSGLADDVRHTLDAGLALDRSLSISSRTMIGFTSGAAIVTVDGHQQAELIGTLNVRRLLSPRWTASAGYQRGLMGLDGVPDPLTTNTLSIDVNGFVGMRTSVLVRPIYTWGADLADPSQSFHSATLVARAQTALARRWAVYAEYVYYDHHFSRIAGVHPSLSADTRRHGLRTGVALWSPLR